MFKKSGKGREARIRQNPFLHLAESGGVTILWAIGGISQQVLCKTVTIVPPDVDLTNAVYLEFT